MVMLCDILTGDPLFSSENPHKVEHGIARVEGKVISTGVCEDEHKMICDVVEENELKVVIFTKRTFSLYFHAYVERVCEVLETTAPRRIEPFCDAAALLIRMVSAEFRNFRFYVGKTQSQLKPDGLIVCLNYVEDGLQPQLLFLSDALVKKSQKKELI